METNDNDAILIVEDDPDSRYFLTSFLNAEGYPTIDCVHSEEVRQRLSDTSPRLAIIDINLPSQHGVSLAWELRNRWPSMPIIIASAMVFNWDVDDIYDCGADYVIQKPFDISMLEEVVRGFYTQVRAVGETIRQG